MTKVSLKTYRNVIRMKQIGKRSCKYIAKKLGLAESTVKQIR